MASVPFRFAIVSAVLVLIAIAAHAERKVYKCTDAKGVVVFSEQPCGQDAKEMNVDPGRVEKPAVTPAGDASGEKQPPTPAVKHAPPDALRDISDAADDASCRREAEHLAIVRFDDHLDDLIRRKNNIASEIAYANNNLAGAVWEQGLRNQIGDMEIAIEQERARRSMQELQAQAVSHDALARCDEAKAAREKARTQ
jgi:hypothetical protein